MDENNKELISKALEKADEGNFDKLTDNELEAVAGGARATTRPRPTFHCPYCGKGNILSEGELDSHKSICPNKP